MATIKHDPPKPYPDPEATAVPPQLQGPNEQSIVASGMTVEEWKRKHPNQVLGPDPEEIGQVTTDPPDDSPPATPFPATGTSVDPHGVITATFEENPQPVTAAVPPGRDPGTDPVTSDIIARGEELTEEEKTMPDPKEEPVQEPIPVPVEPEPEPEPDDEPEEEESEDPEQTGASAQALAYQSFTRHDQLDQYVEENDIKVGQEWSAMTIAQKKSWLDDNS